MDPVAPRKRTARASVTLRQAVDRKEAGDRENLFDCCDITLRAFL
jgi:hypothetical protein